MPFFFVPDGHPQPSDWLARHPGAIRLRATLTPRQPGEPDSLQVMLPDEADTPSGRVPLPGHARLYPSPPVVAAMVRETIEPIGSFKEAAAVFANPGRAAGLLQAPADATAIADRSTASADRRSRTPGTLPAASRLDQPQPRAMPPVPSPPKAVLIDIFVGGLFDGTFMNVKHVYNDYNRTHPDARYFSHDQGDEIAAAIAAAPAGSQINLIGHSWGADTAAKVAASSTRRINTLITVDPVSMIRPDFAQVRENTNTWVDVNAYPRHSDSSDVVAGIGDDWGNRPAGIATKFIEVNDHHANFRSLLMTPGLDGRSAFDVLKASR